MKIHQFFRPARSLIDFCFHLGRSAKRMDNEMKMGRAPTIRLASEQFKLKAQKVTGGVEESVL